MTTFVDVRSALRAGWMLYDRTPDGYLIKQRFISGWKIGRIILTRKGDGA